MLKRFLTPSFLLPIVFIGCVLGNLYVTCLLVGITIGLIVIRGVVMDDIYSFKNLDKITGWFEEFWMCTNLVLTQVAGLILCWLFSNTTGIENMSVVLTLFIFTMFLILSRLRYKRFIPFRRALNLRNRKTIDPDFNY